MVQVSATNKGRYPQPALGKEWKLLGLWGQASGREAPSISAPTARDIIPPILLCTEDRTKSFDLSKNLIWPAGGIFKS